MDRTKYMDRDEVERLRAVTEGRAMIDARYGRRRGPLVWAVVDIALQTGLRVSEIAMLNIEDLNLRRRSLYVWRLKRDIPLRETLAISKDLAKHLKAYIGPRTKGTIFVGERGPMGSRGLQQAWLGAVKRAGLPTGLSIHSARHTMAVLLLAKTHNLRQVQKQLGHSSPETTANMYADVTFEDMQAGVDGLY